MATYMSRLQRGPLLPAVRREELQRGRTRQHTPKGGYGRQAVDGGHQGVHAAKLGRQVQG
jgi:hypothetical protein